MPQGAGVLVNINGGRAMQYLDAPTYERFATHGIEIRGMQSLDELGNLVFAHPGMPAAAMKAQYGVQHIMLPWCVLVFVGGEHCGGCGWYHHQCM